MINELLHPQVQTRDPSSYTHYGYGVWLHRREAELMACFEQGSTPGVAMSSAWFSEQDLILMRLKNADRAVWPVLKRIQSTLELP